MSITNDLRPGEQLGTGERLLLTLGLDVSWSMGQNGGLARLRTALATWITELKTHEFGDRINLAIVTFGNGKATVLNLAGGAGEPTRERSFVPVTQARFEPQSLTADGNTPLGLGITRAIDIIDGGKAYLRANSMIYYAPLVWILTDGQPNDRWQEPAQRLLAMEQGNHALTFAVGFGNADRAVLAQLAPEANYTVDEVNMSSVLRIVSGSAGALAGGASAGEVKAQVKRRMAADDNIKIWLNQVGTA